MVSSLQHHKWFSTAHCWKSSVADHILSVWEQQWKVCFSCLSCACVIYASCAFSSFCPVCQQSGHGASSLTGIHYCCCHSPTPSAPSSSSFSSPARLRTQWKMFISGERKSLIKLWGSNTYGSLTLSQDTLKYMIISFLIKPKFIRTTNLN